MSLDGDWARVTPAEKAEPAVISVVRPQKTFKFLLLYLAVIVCLAVT